VRPLSSGRDGVAATAPSPASFAVSLFFGLAFGGVGAGVAVVVGRAAVEPAPALLPLTLLTFVALLFGSIGVLVLIGVVFRSSMRSEWDPSPTLAKEWERGRIVCSTKTAVWLWWGIFAGVGLSLAPSFGVVFLEIAGGDLGRAWWLATGAFVIVPLVLASAATLRFRRQGEGLCHLPRGAGRIGGELHVLVVAPTRIEPSGDYRAVLTCRTTALDGERAGSKQTVWQDERAAPRHGVRSTSGIPFRFAIPRSLPPADAAGAHALTRWDLVVTAPTARGEYRASFQLPVLD
jgi:hypothetical protein